MTQLLRVLAEIRASTATTSLQELAQRLGVSRDDLDVMIGYWVHRGELIVEESAACTTGDCRGCALARRGCTPHQSGPVLVTIRPTRQHCE
jgi:hypothetical protein